MFNKSNFCTPASYNTVYCRASFTTFDLITSGSGMLCTVHHSSMLLVINMDIAKGHMRHAHVPPNKK